MLMPQFLSIGFCRLLRSCVCMAYIRWMCDDDSLELTIFGEGGRGGGGMKWFCNVNINVCATGGVC